MKTVTKKISDLSHDPHNARRHPSSNISAIAASLKEFGQQKPIVITSDNVIIAGNGTYDAAVSLGWSDIAVTVLPADWDSNKAKAFALADNRTAELAEWDSHELLQQLESLTDFDMSVFGFDLSEQTDFEVDTENMGGESRGLGTPIIHYDIVFDDETQQAIWFKFMKKLRELYPNEDTLASRLTIYIEGKDSE